jgi:hypothetical protein
MSKLLLKVGSYHTIKEQMVTGLNLIAEDTSQVIHILPFTQVIPS